MYVSREVRTSSTYTKVKKAISVTGSGGLQYCEVLRIPHCLDSRFIDGGEFASLTRRPPPYSSEILFFCF
jgi:hypothetical protein